MPRGNAQRKCPEEITDDLGPNPCLSLRAIKYPSLDWISEKNTSNEA